MPQPKNKHELIERESRAWKMRVVGHSECSIAAALGVTQQAVNLMLKRVYARKSAELESVVTEQKVVVLARLEWAAAEAAEAWERSKEDAEITTVNTKKLGNGVVSGDEGGFMALPFARDPEAVPGGLYPEQTRRAFFLDDDGEEIEPEERARRLRDAGKEKRAARLFRADAQTGEIGNELTIVEEKTAVRTYGQTGTPAHLANVLKATQDVRDLLGLDAPKDATGGIQVVIKTYGTDSAVSIVDAV